jgi:hypothetical protein
MLRRTIASGNGRYPTLVPGRLAGDDVWFVEVVFPDGRVDQVGAFGDQSETRDWITHKSAAWIADYEQRRTNDQ